MQYLLRETNTVRRTSIALGIVALCVFTCSTSASVAFQDAIMATPIAEDSIPVPIEEDKSPISEPLAFTRIDRYYKTFVSPHCCRPYKYVTYNWNKVDGDCISGNIKAYKTIILFFYPDGSYSARHGNCTRCSGGTSQGALGMNFSRQNVGLLSIEISESDLNGDALLWSDGGNRDSNPTPPIEHFEYAIAATLVGQLQVSKQASYTRRESLFSMIKRILEPKGWR